MRSPEILDIFNYSYSKHVSSRRFIKKNYLMLVCYNKTAYYIHYYIIILYLGQLEYIYWMSHKGFNGTIAPSIKSQELEFLNEINTASLLKMITYMKCSLK